METGFQRLGLGADTPWWHDSSQGAEDKLDASVSRLSQQVLKTISDEDSFPSSFAAFPINTGGWDTDLKELFGDVVIPPPFQRSSTEDISPPAQPFPMVDISQRSEQASGTGLNARRERSGQKRKAKPEPRALHPLVENFWTVTRPGEVQCKSCDTSMIGVLSQMNKHLETHDIESPFICGRENCDHTASTKAELKEHLHTAHPDRRKPCLFCNFELPRNRSAQELVDHTRAHHFLNGKKPFQCFDCIGTAFASIKNLASHIYRIHPLDSHHLSLANALSSIGVTIATTTIDYSWTGTLIDFYYNDRSGLPKANPGFALEDKNLIEQALRTGDSKQSYLQEII